MRHNLTKIVSGFGAWRHNAPGSTVPQARARSTLREPSESSGASERSACSRAGSACEGRASTRRRRARATAATGGRSRFQKKGPSYRGASLCTGQAVAWSFKASSEVTGGRPPAGTSRWPHCSASHHPPLRSSSARPSRWAGERRRTATRPSYRPRPRGRARA